MVRRPSCAVWSAAPNALQVRLSRIQLYELLSEIGFIRVSARFTDFVYRPLVPTLANTVYMRNTSVLLENMPLDWAALPH